MKLILIIGVSMLFIVLMPSISAEVRYCISGRVVYSLYPVPGVKVICISNDQKIYVEAVTDEKGDFFVFVPNGIYLLNVEDEEYVDSNVIPAIVTIADKNIQNIILLVEKGCRISGHIKYSE